MRTTILVLVAASTLASAATVAKVHVDVVVPGGFPESLDVDVPLGQYYMSSAWNSVSKLTLVSPSGVICKPYIEDSNGGHDGPAFSVGKPAVLSTTTSVKVRQVWCA
ncbi:hypothetical protein F5Y17DRAFT_413193 [Xylariaceae sp. FL0594]|nr:hypothetical protein F5Y17DRAFT_413193 [Xylariaceae sp. FL0594]